MNYHKSGISASKTLALDAFNTSLQQSPRWTISHRAIAPLAMIFDALIIFATSMLSGIVYSFETNGSPGNLTQFGGFAAVVAALFIALAKSYNLYSMSELLNFKSQIRKAVTIWIFVFLFFTMVIFVMKVGGNLSRGTTLSFAVSGIAILIAARSVWRIFLSDDLAVRKFSGRKVALIADQVSAVDSGLLEALTRHGMELTNYFLLPADRNDASHRKEVIAQTISAIRGSNIEEIIVSTNLDYWSDLKNLLAELRVLPLPVNLVPVGVISELFKLSSRRIGTTVTIELQRNPRTVLEQLVTRVFDIIIAGTALILLLPLFLFTAIAIAVDSPGPILFRQQRRGFNGRPFKILKFRSMMVMEDGESIVQARPNDPRVTNIGNWLRRTSIDELPQLFNVLQGSMSIVGPRPHAVAHDNEFDRLVHNYAYRQHVKPGLTGWAQVNGYRGQLRSTIDIEKRVEFDLWYIDNWNLALDFKIILMTVIEIIRGHNAY
jgi:Undecaprenyl-phosphate glucose phosphotransferase